MSLYNLTPLTHPYAKYRIVAFDVEGTGEPGGFLLGCIWDDDGPQFFYSSAQMSAALLSAKYRGARIFAHNLEYDWGVLFQDNTEGWKVYRLGSNVVRAEYRDKHNHVWHFWDTSNLSAFQSLGAIGQILGIEKLEPPRCVYDHGLDPKRRDRCAEREADQLERYCARDAEICYLYARHIQQVLNDLGGQLKPTLASCALDLFRRSFLDRSYYVPPASINDLCRQAYYGGRTEALTLGTTHCARQYDVHSMYPSVMCFATFPDPNTMFTVYQTPNAYNIGRYPGVTKCTVTAPPMAVPVLPVRIKKRLVFPLGTFSGVWCHNELSYAVEHGYTIDRMDWQICFQGDCQPFKRYVNELYYHKERAQANADPSFFVYKLLLNSLYGKFGQRIDDRLTSVRRVESGKALLSATGVELLEWQGQAMIAAPVQHAKQPNYIITVWAAYVTAYARIKLHCAMMSCDWDVAYTDTDSIVTVSALPDHNALGGWGCEFGPGEFQIRAEKYYRKRRPGEPWQYVKAGVPRQHQAQFWLEGQVAFQRPTKIGESLKTGTRLSVWRDVTKTDRVRHFKRRPLRDAWNDAEMVKTRPWTYQEAVAHYEAAPELPPWRVGTNLEPQEVERRELAFLKAWQLEQNRIAAKKGA